MPAKVEIGTADDKAARQAARVSQAERQDIGASIDAIQVSIGAVDGVITSLDKTAFDALTNNQKLELLRKAMVDLARETKESLRQNRKALRIIRGMLKD